MVSPEPSPRPVTSSLLLEWVKVLAWPSFAFVCMIIFWQPIREAVLLLPSMLQRSDEMNIGTFKLKMTLPSSAELRAKASPRVAAALASLSANSIRYLIEEDLRSSDLYTTANDGSAERIAANELVERNLCVFKTEKQLSSYAEERQRIESAKERMTYTYGISCGEGYRQARDLLLEVVIPEFIARIRAEPERTVVKTK